MALCTFVGGGAVQSLGESRQSGRMWHATFSNVNDLHMPSRQQVDLSRASPKRECGHSTTRDLALDVGHGTVERDPWNGGWTRTSVATQARAGRLRGRHTATTNGRWPMVAPGGGVERYAALRCLWHEIRVDERTNR
eukprot:2969937-Prymnesium_polylepis.1